MRKAKITPFKANNTTFYAFTLPSQESNLRHIVRRRHYLQKKADSSHR